MLTLKNISLTAPDAQGRADILKNVSLDVADGRFLVVTGPNGGGKTTLAKLIMGLMTPTAGQIFFDGEDITARSITERARLGISYSFQQPPRTRPTNSDENAASRSGGIVCSNASSALTFVCSALASGHSSVTSGQAAPVSHLLTAAALTPS